jgi:hypothetical protein
MTSNEKIELQSCRSRQKLEISYKVYLYLSSYKNIMIFLKTNGPSSPCATAVTGAIVTNRRGPQRFVTVAPAPIMV